MKVEQRRRLTDLYSRGHDIKIVDEESGFFDEAYLRKMTPPELDEAFARATAARSRVIAATKDGSDEAFLSLKRDVEQMSHDDLVGWVVSSEMVPRKAIVEAQVGDDDEWSKDKYLFGLQEFAASDDFQAKPDDDPEKARITGELARYQAKVEELLKEEEEGFRAQWQDAPDERLRERVLEEIYSMKGNSEWLVEYKKSQIWLCTHESTDHKKRYFDSREEIDQLQKPVVERLLEEIEKLHVPDAEGKDSEPSPSS